MAQRIAVIGGGIAGLAAARTLLEAAPHADIVVLERSRRAGGLIETERTPEGFLVEHGADSLVTLKPRGVEIVRELGMDGAIVHGKEPQSFVLADGELRPLPNGLLGLSREAVASIARSPLLSIRGKARLGLEPFIGRGRGDIDESVASFVTRRLGAEMLEAIVEPLLRGIYGAPASELSAEVCLGQLRALERRHGSITSAIARPAGPRPALPPMVTLRDGMESLVAALARRAGGALRLGVDVRAIERGKNGRFRLQLADDALDADGVVVAAPAWAAAPLVEAIDPALSGLLASVRHGALDCVSFAWPCASVPHSLDGTGFVNAGGGAGAMLACTWASRKWPGRAPDDHVLIRCVLAGTDEPEAAVTARALRELSAVIGVTSPPDLVRFRRHARGTPILEVGHLERVERMRERAAAIGGLALAGNAHSGGIGIADCVGSGERAARAVLADLDGDACLACG